MPEHLLRVCITGPESTGKTTLARQLGEWAGTEWVPEAARAYAERKAGVELLAEDVSPIAREHITMADAALARAVERDARLLVLDTDLLSTVVYARHYYGAAPRWVERAERARRADLYLLCDVDIPWFPDGVRDRPKDREGMFATFRAALLSRRVNVEIIRGNFEERIARAKGFVQQLRA